MLESLIHNLTQWLASCETLRDVRFTVEYPPADKTAPLTRPIAAVGLAKADIRESAVGGGYEAELRLSCSIHAPLSADGGAVTDLFARLCDALLFRSPLRVTRAELGSVLANRTAGALRAEASFTVRMDLTQKEAAADG